LRKKEKEKQKPETVENKNTEEKRVGNKLILEGYTSVEGDIAM
jgi:hypothetical protein